MEGGDTMIPGQRATESHLRNGGHWRVTAETETELTVYYPVSQSTSVWRRIDSAKAKDPIFEVVEERLG